MGDVLPPGSRKSIYDFGTREKRRKGKHSELEMIGALKQPKARRMAAETGRGMRLFKRTSYAWRAK